MESCPQLTELNEPGADRDAVAVHLRTCDVCRALTVLAAGYGTDVERSAECERLEPLMAAAADGPLRAQDRQRLDDHLDNCGRCVAVAATVYLEDVMPVTNDAVAATVRPVIPETTAVQPMRRETEAPSRRAPVWAAIVAVAAAAMLFVLWRGVGTDTPVAETYNPPQPVGAGRLMPPTKPPTNPTPTNRTPTPIVVADNPDQPSTNVVEQLVNQAKAAAKASETGKALRLCEQALAISPGNEEAAMVCVIAACKLKNPSKAKTYIGSLKSSARYAMARKLCLSNGVRVAPRLVSEKAAEAREFTKKIYEGARKYYEDDNEPAAKATVKPGTRSAKELVNDAKAAAKASQLGKALRLCEKALELSRGNQEATMVCAIAACKLKHASKAKKYINRLRSTQRASMARQLCLANGVEVKGR